MRIRYTTAGDWNCERTSVWSCGFRARTRFYRASNNYLSIGKSTVQCITLLQVTGITNGNYQLETEVGSLLHISAFIAVVLSQVTPGDVLRLEVVPSQENYQDHISTVVTGLQK